MNGKKINTKIEEKTKAKINRKKDRAHNGINNNRLKKKNRKNRK